MERLSRDLSIYSMGLFPLLGHSAMSVRPKLFGMLHIIISVCLLSRRVYL